MLERVETTIHSVENFLFSVQVGGMSGDASERVRWGILSTALISTRLCEAMKASRNATPLAVCSRSVGKAREWADKHGVERAYGSYDELLDDPDVEAV